MFSRILEICLRVCNETDKDCSVSSSWSSSGIVFSVRFSFSSSPCRVTGKSVGNHHFVTYVAVVCVFCAFPLVVCLSCPRYSHDTAHRFSPPSISWKRTDRRNIGNHDCGATQDEHTLLLLDLVKKLLCFLTLCDWQHTWKYVCTSKDLEDGIMEYLWATVWGFLGSQQLPPEHTCVL